MEEELSFTDEELLSIDCPQDFKRFLISLDEEYGIASIDDFLRFYLQHEYLEHCNVLIAFKKDYLR
jgi:hypothetical protein